MKTLVINKKGLYRPCRNVLAKVHYVSNEWPHVPIFKFHCYRLVSAEADATMEIGVGNVYL